MAGLEEWEQVEAVKEPWQYLIMNKEEVEAANDMNRDVHEEVEAGNDVNSRDEVGAANDMNKEVEAGNDMNSEDELEAGNDMNSKDELEAGNVIDSKDQVEAGNDINTNDEPEELEAGNNNEAVKPTESNELQKNKEESRCWKKSKLVVVVAVKTRLRALKWVLKNISSEEVDRVVVVTALELDGATKPEVFEYAKKLFKGYKAKVTYRLVTDMYSLVNEVRADMLVVGKQRGCLVSSCLFMDAKCPVLAVESEDHEESSRWCLW